MKIKDLIKILEQEDPELEIYLEFPFVYDFVDIKLHKENLIKLKEEHYNPVIPDDEFHLKLEISPLFDSQPHLFDTKEIMLITNVFKGKTYIDRIGKIDY